MSSKSLVWLIVLLGAAAAQESRTQPSPAPRGSGPLAVSGRVVDNSLKPIYAAKVFLQVREKDGQWVDIIWDDGDAWSDYSGAFAIRRVLQAHETYRVAASKDNHWLEEAIEFTPGKT